MTMVGAKTFVLTGTRGAQTRTRILDALADEPGTCAELATRLDTDRGSLDDHLDILETNGIVAVDRRSDEPTYDTAEEAPTTPR